MVGRRSVELQFRLVLDSATRSDEDTVVALRGVFPASLQPDVSVAEHLTESMALGQPLITLIITGCLWWTGWAVKKVTRPPLEEVGEWLRDMVRQLRERRKVVPDAVTLRVERAAQPSDISIGIPVEFLEELQWFSTLDHQLAEAVSQPPFSNADRLMLSWNRERETWACTIWPADMASTHEYFVYDLKAGRYEKMQL